MLFDYEKQQDDELNLKVGETITNVTQVYIHSVCVCRHTEWCKRCCVCMYRAM